MSPLLRLLLLAINSCSILLPARATNAASDAACMGGARAGWPLAAAHCVPVLRRCTACTCASAVCSVSIAVLMLALAAMPLRHVDGMLACMTPHDDERGNSQAGGHES